MHRWLNGRVATGAAPAAPVIPPREAAAAKDRGTEATADAAAAGKDTSAVPAQPKAAEGTLVLKAAKKKSTPAELPTALGSRNPTTGPVRASRRQRPVRRYREYGSDDDFWSDSDEEWESTAEKAIPSADALSAAPKAAKKRKAAAKTIAQATERRRRLPRAPKPSTEADVEAPSWIVEKILAGRKEQGDGEAGGAFAELFLIKWKGRSYMHASWERRQDIEVVDRKGKFKIKRYLDGLPDGIPVRRRPADAEAGEKDSEPAAGGSDGTARGGTGDGDGAVDVEEDDEFIPAEYMEVHRIIAASTAQPSHPIAPRRDPALDEESTAVAGIDAADTGPAGADAALAAEGTKYLVKWLSLPYSECTWEDWATLKERAWEAEDAVRVFWERQDASKVPSEEVLPLGFRPPLSEFKRCEASPVFGLQPWERATAAAEEGGGLRLRSYQLEGVNWLMWNWWQRRPCILADEMGLGKTIQTIAFMERLSELQGEGMAGPFLVVAPLSLMLQWESEITTWAPWMNTLVYHGNASAREALVRNELWYQEPYVDGDRAAELYRRRMCKFDVLVTTYEIAIRDLTVLQKVPWRLLVVDEAHRLKSVKAKLFTQLNELKRDHCILLTGTPLQNKTEELWALLHFADRARFMSESDFLERFGNLHDAEQVAALHGVLKPYLLRRVKEDVEKSLPPKEETIIEVSLTNVQRQFYKAIYERNTAFLYKGTKASNAPSLMNVMMELRKCCNHPYLNRGVEERIVGQLPAESRGATDALSEQLVRSCGKMVLLDKLLPRLFAQGRKVLIFSQMVRVLDLIERYLRWKQYKFERLDGSTRSSLRHAAVQRFSRGGEGDGRSFVMLLSTRAGGVGLNLTVADTVVIYDSDWNPHNDLQAQARAHRIGQTKAVMVYRLLTKKTYEMHMFHSASMKLGLDRAMLSHARAQAEGSGGSGAMSKGTEQLLAAGTGRAGGALKAQEIDELLKRGAYDVFREEDEGETRAFEEADIDAILERSTTKVSYDGAKSGGAASALSSFSKASFVALEDGQEEVDLDDPDFWKKAIGLDAPAEEEAVDPAVADASELDFIANLPAQRRRRQARFFGMAHSDTDDSEAEYEASSDDDDGGDEKGGSDSDTSERGGAGASSSRGSRRDGRRAKDGWPMSARDRLIRAVHVFGFGRWDVLLKETGLNDKTAAEVETFVRALVLQCGLHVTPVEGDPQFVHDSHRAARAVAENGALAETVRMPDALTEERFVKKLLAGSARRTLNKLSTLGRLHHVVYTAMRGAAQALAVDTSVTAELAQNLNSAIEQGFDTALGAFLDAGGKAMAALEKAFPYGNVRPNWARPTTWWGGRADIHLVLGTALYGYGRSERAASDDRLMFNKITSLKDLQPPAREQSSKHATVEGLVSWTEADGSIVLLVPQVARLRIPSVAETASMTPRLYGVRPQRGSTCWTAHIRLPHSQEPVLIGLHATQFAAAMAFDTVARNEKVRERCFDSQGKPASLEKDAHDPHAPAGGVKLVRSGFRGVFYNGDAWFTDVKALNMGVLGPYLTETEAALAFDYANVSSGLPACNFVGGIQVAVAVLAKGLPPENVFIPKVMPDSRTLNRIVCFLVDCPTALEVVENPVFENAAMREGAYAPRVQNGGTREGARAPRSAGGYRQGAAEGAQRGKAVSPEEVQAAQERKAVTRKMQLMQSIGKKEQRLLEAARTSFNHVPPMEPGVVQDLSRRISHFIETERAKEGANDRCRSPSRPTLLDQSLPWKAWERAAVFHWLLENGAPYHRLFTDVPRYQGIDIIDRDLIAGLAPHYELAKTALDAAVAVEKEIGQLNPAEVLSPAGAAAREAFATYKSAISALGAKPWEVAVQEMGLERPAWEVIEYYRSKLLPRLVDLADGFGGEGPEANFFPDPMRMNSEESEVAVKLALHFARRLLFVRQARAVVARKGAQLLQNLSMARSRAVRALPAWWCPWIHDAALLLLLATSGIGALHKFCAGISGPGEYFLGTEAAMRFATKVFFDPRSPAFGTCDASMLPAIIEERPTLLGAYERISRILKDFSKADSEMPSVGILFPAPVGPGEYAIAFGANHAGADASVKTEEQFLEEVAEIVRLPLVLRNSYERLGSGEKVSPHVAAKSSKRCLQEDGGSAGGGDTAGGDAAGDAGHKRRKQEV